MNVALIGIGDTGVQLEAPMRYSPVETTSTQRMPHVVQHTADSNRRKRRALVKAVGARQFKKFYRKAQA